MKSKLFTLNLSDFAKGAVTAVIAGVVFAVGGVIQQQGFDVFSADWGAILNIAINAALAAFIGYIGKNFISDSNGEVLGSADDEGIA